ncbi:hypothetical protein X743_14180 [Mesorhizobium sp. LNHC252B00]|nr:hypothetical protein X743_14180 [Mesorhizobium sp. LNHC252B00]
MQFPTNGRNEDLILFYVENQEMADRQLGQLEIRFSTF